MIVVFVVDTSPSMGQPIQNPSSSSSSTASATSMLSRLDLAKMAVEDLTKGLTRRTQEHNVFLQQQSPAVQKSMCQIGLGYAPPNQFLLLSTSRQHTDQPATAACGAGGRLLVGFGPDSIYSSSTDNNNNNNGGGPEGGMSGDPFHPGNGNGGDGGPNAQAAANNIASFQRELKQLQASTWDPTTVAAAAAAAAIAKGVKPSSKPPSFPDDAGGAGGLNAALSAGLQQLSRYRLHDRATEHFGMGRLPSPAMIMETSATQQQVAAHALQPACVILLTDGACLRKPPAEGGGALQLQYGSMPLREWYKEPFRWDQRVICLGVGAATGGTSTQYLHPQLRALCEVTGGHHSMLRSTATLSTMTDRLLRILTPPLPRHLPFPDPLKSPVTATNSTSVATTSPNGTASFINGGPVCCFQAIEGDMDGTSGGGTVYRAMILYVPCPSPLLTPTDDVPDNLGVSFPSPLWCIPENFFPRRTLDTLPPRSAQPMLMISRFPSKLGRSFEPTILMKQLHRLDQLILSTKQLLQSATPVPANQQQQQQQMLGGTVKMLHRDTYICEWVAVDDRPAKAPQPNVYGGSEYFPVMVQDAGRPTDDSNVNSGTANYFHIGILHAPASTSTLATSTMSASSRPFSTLTLLPPEPQLLIPLLLKAADAEHRAFKKAIQTATANDTVISPEVLAVISRTVHVDEAWKQDFRHYAARLPPYYQMAMKRGLRSVLPIGFHPLLVTALASDPSTGAPLAGADAVMSSSSSSSLSMQSFSKVCFQRIRSAEQVARETNERLERQEAELRGVAKPIMDPQQQQQQQSPSSGRPQLHRSNSAGNQLGQLGVGYGQYDPRSTTESFLSSLRSLPAPWLVGMDSDNKKRNRDTDEPSDAKSKAVSSQKDSSSKATEANTASGSNGTGQSAHDEHTPRNAMECLGDLPANCLMAYYESRRRWVFGGSGLTTRGLMVEGVSNDGSNTQRCGANPNDSTDQSPLSLAGVGVSTLNATTVAKMGDYRERLLWSRSPVVGYGSNDSCGVAATTASDGSPKWSVDDDVMPMTFFDSKTAEFSDSVQARVRSRLMVNFGNAYKDKRADSLVPEQFLSQCPSNHQQTNTTGDSPQHPGSPPHDSYSGSVEEGEALFTKSPPPKSPPHSSSLSLSPRPPPLKPPKRDNTDSASTDSGHTDPDEASATSSASPPPPPPNKKQRTDGDFKASPKPIPKTTPGAQRMKRGDRSGIDAKLHLPMTPTTPPVGPPKMRLSPGSTPGGTTLKPPPPPPMSPKASPMPPPKGSASKRPPPPPPGGKKPPPPPSLDKRPSFQLAPSKPLPNIPMKKPSSTLGTPPSSLSKDGSGEGSKKLPPPPSLPKSAKLEAATSGGSSSSAASGSKNRPPPPGPPKQIAPPPPAPRQRSGSITSNTLAGAKPPPPKPLEYTNKDKKPNVSLPAEWMCVWSKSQTRWYFFNGRSNKSVWEWPPP